MKLPLVSVALVLTACGDHVYPDDPLDESTATGTPDGDQDTPARDFVVSPLIVFPSCDAPLAAFEADARYVDAPFELVPNIRCVWAFDDGATFEGCAGEHVFAVGDWHDFTVAITDLDTGETRTATQRRFVYPPIEATLEVSTSDLSISYVATTNRGNEVHVFVEPADKILVDDPLYHLRLVNTVRVTEPGTYSVTLTVEDERPVGPICSARIQQDVIVCPPGDHPE